MFHCPVLSLSFTIFIDTSHLNVCFEFKKSHKSKYIKEDKVEGLPGKRKLSGFFCSLVQHVLHFSLGSLVQENLVLSQVFVEYTGPNVQCGSKNCCLNRVFVPSFTIYFHATVQHIHVHVSVL